MPFVVMFDTEYEKGNVNPLDRSNQLVKGSSWLIFALILVTFVIALLIQKLGANNDELVYIFSPIATALSMTVSIYTYILFYKIFLIKHKTFPHEVSNEPTV